MSGQGTSSSGEVARHLTDEAMVRLQMGDAGTAERDHLAGCVECQEKVAPLEEALRWFGAAAREFGEEKASARARQVAFTPAVRHWSGTGLQAGLAMALMLLMLVAGIAFPRWQQHRAAAARLAQEQREQQLAQDNELLQQVEEDLSQIVPDAMESLSWSSTEGGSAAHERASMSGRNGRMTRE